MSWWDFLTLLFGPSRRSETRRLRNTPTVRPRASAAPGAGCARRGDWREDTDGQVDVIASRRPPRSRPWSDIYGYAATTAAGPLAPRLAMDAGQGVMPMRGVKWNLANLWNSQIANGGETSYIESEKSSHLAELSPDGARAQRSLG
jgi:hypothetical protein